MPFLKGLYINEKSSQWKGDLASSKAIHHWVRKRYICPDKCEICKEIPPYDIHNITGIVNREFINWIWVCRCCHMELDGRLLKLKPTQFKKGLREPGPGSSNWKGQNAKDVSIRDWVRRKLIRPDKCEICMEKSPYDLSNKTGVVNREFTNWIWLCRSCHMKLDGRMSNLKQYSGIKGRDVR